MPNHLDGEHKSRLTAPRPTEVPLCRELIDMFMGDKRWTQFDRVTMTFDTARSELVVHPRDKSLRIDYQKPFNASCPRCIAGQRNQAWANLALQRGAATYACVLMERQRAYPAAEVRQAWLDSLAAQQNAHMEWSFVATKLEYAALGSLDANQARTIAEVFAQMQRSSTWGFAGQLGLSFQAAALIGGTLEYPEGLLLQVLRDLMAAGLARKQPLARPTNPARPAGRPAGRPPDAEGWILTPAGTQYLANQANNPFAIG